MTNLLATSVNMAVLAQDFYFGGPGDSVEGLTVTPLGERYFGQVADIPALGRDTIKGAGLRHLAKEPNELGVLLFTNGDRGSLNRGATKATEAAVQSHAVADCR